jgi:hypothetical protein
MIKNPNPSLEFSWQALLWRLLLTLLLLLALAGPGLTFFKSVTSRPGTRALPSLVETEADLGGAADSSFSAR